MVAEEELLEEELPEEESPEEESPEGGVVELSPALLDAVSLRRLSALAPWSFL